MPPEDNLTDTMSPNLTELIRLYQDLSDRVQDVTATYNDVPFQDCEIDIINETVATISALKEEMSQREFEARLHSEDETLRPLLSKVKAAVPRLNNFLLKLRIRRSALERRDAPQENPMDLTAAASPSGYWIADGDVPEFSGDSKTWKHWWNVYKHTVHENPRVPLDKKYKILTSTLTNEARGLIGQPQWTQEAYDKCIEILKEEYTPTPSQARVLLQNLKSVPPPQDNGRDLLRFVTRFRTVVTEYEDMSGNTLPDASIAQYLEDLVPADLLAKLYDKHDSCDLTAVQFYRGLKTIGTNNVVAGNVTSYPSPSGPRAKGPPPPVHHSSKPPGAQPKAPRPSAPAVAPRPASKPPHQPAPPSQPAPPPTLPPQLPPTRNQSAPQGPAPFTSRAPHTPCRFCGAMHFPSQCPSYPDVDSRKALLQAQGRCTECFAFDHGENPCYLHQPCHACLGSHRYPVCPNAHFKLAVNSLITSPSFLQQFKVSSPYPTSYSHPTCPPPHPTLPYTHPYVPPHAISTPLPRNVAPVRDTVDATTSTGPSHQGAALTNSDSQSA